MKIINFEKFKEEVSKYDKPALKSLLDYFAFKRILEELVIVDGICSCRENGEAIPNAEVVDSYNNALEGERILIGFLGRQEAAKVYGLMEGITSDIKTVDYILSPKSQRNAGENTK